MLWVRERGAFGCARCARGELDIDRVVDLEAAAALVQCREIAGVSRLQQVIEIEHPGRTVRAKPDHAP